MPTTENWPFTDDDLLAIVVVGVWYDFEDGEGRTEFAYQILAEQPQIKRKDGPVSPFSLKRFSDLDKAT